MGVTDIIRSLGFWFFFGGKKKPIEKPKRRKSITRHFLVEEVFPPDLRFEDVDTEVQKNVLLLGKKLEDLRKELDNPLIINNYHVGGNRRYAGYRTMTQNIRVGGARGSWHLVGLAADVYAPGKTLKQLEKAAKKVGFTEVIRYDDMHFVHCALE